MPKISFIVPVYNMEKYLRCCLDSILCQTEPDFEVILVDDGSTDKSAEICKEYVGKDSRFLYLYQKNAWLSAARNTGLAHARGEYISFVDSDDYIEPNFAEVLYRNAKKTGADIVCFGFKKNVGNDIVVEIPGSKMVDISRDTLLEHYCRDWLLPQRRNYVCTKLFRREFVGSTGVVFYTNARYCEDRNFCYKIFFQSKRIAYISKALYHYQQHEKSITHSAALSENIFRYYLDCYSDYCAYWESKKMHTFDPVKPIALIRTLQGALYNTQQATNNLEMTAKAAVEAFENFPLSSELEISRLKEAISIYSEICALNWGEQSKIWLFALSVLDGKNGIVTWQKLYPLYSQIMPDGLSQPEI